MPTQSLMYSYRLSNEEVDFWIKRSGITNEIGIDPYSKPNNVGVMTIYKTDYTLKQLTSMPFEQWARLIEIENINNNA